MNRRFMCENSRFKTNTRKGFSHGQSSKLRGSVFEQALFINDECSLWLEHVSDSKERDKDFFWLMWYDQHGIATIKESAVIDRSGLANLLSSLTTLIL